MKLPRLVLPAVTIAASLAASAAPASAAFPGTSNGRIAFWGGHSGQTGILSMQPDGSDIRALVVDGNISSPTWSPDGRRVAFDRAGQIGVVEVADGSVVMLTDRSEIGTAYEPAWSHDGAKVAFTGSPDNGGPYYGAGTSTDVYTVDADGTNVTRITTTDNEFERSPAWSPDGSKIAYLGPTETPSFSYDIYTMHPDGTGRFNVTKGGYNGAPDWSPDGSRLVFAATGWGGDGTISTIRADGSDARDLVYVGSRPVYSPDGTTIAFERMIPFPSRPGIAMIPAAGGSLTTISTVAGYAGEPDWQAVHGTPPVVTPPATQPPPGETAAAPATIDIAAVLGSATRRLRRIGLRGLLAGFTFEQTVPTPGTLQIDVLGRTARASAAAKRRPKLIATGRARATAAGKVKVRVKPTKAGRKALKRSKRMKVTLRVSFTPTGGKKTVKSKKLTLRRRPR